MRIVSRKAQACEQVRLRASQLRDRTAVHVRPPRGWPRAVMSLAPRQRGGTGARRVVHKKSGTTCVGPQLTSHLGKLKVPELCLAAFAAAWVIDGNARRSSAG